MLVVWVPYPDSLYTRHSLRRESDSTARPYQNQPSEELQLTGCCTALQGMGRKLRFAVVHMYTYVQIPFPNYAKDQTQPNQPTNKSLFPRCSVRCTPLCSDWATGRRGSDGLRTWTEPMSRQRILLQPPSAKTARSSSRLEGRLGKDGREPQF